MLSIMCVHLDELIRLTRRVARYTQHLPIVCHGLPGAAKKSSPLDMRAETNRPQYVLNITITNCSRMRGGSNRRKVAIGGSSPPVGWSG